MVKLSKGRCQGARLADVGFHGLERTSKDPTHLVSPTTAVIEFHPSPRNTTNFRSLMYAPSQLQPHSRARVRLKLPRDPVAILRRVS